MPKSKRATLKARLVKAERLGYDSGFAQGRKASERLHASLLAVEKDTIRKELAKDARLARYETVTKGVQTMFNAFGQAIDVLTLLDRKVD